MDSAVADVVIRENVGGGEWGGMWDGGEKGKNEKVDAFTLH